MKLASRFLTIVAAMAMACPVVAQNWYRINTHFDSSYNNEWSFPYDVTHFSHYEFSADGKYVRMRTLGDDSEAFVIPYSLSFVDSITFTDDVPEELQSHNKYQVYTLNVTTRDMVGVDSKEEYVDCYVSLDGKDGYNCYSGTARIRGRGNSTWEWYDKKPYRIKLDSKHKMLGLEKNKDWVLLANYRDVTDLMNTFMFEVARWMGMPYVNHTRYVELFLDGDYKGLYQLTEQVEQGKSRVNVEDDGGILVTMDVDDGPDGKTASSSSFWSSEFNIPMSVKYPKDATNQQVDSVKSLLAELENVIKQGDYIHLDSLMDMKSFMTMALLQEYSYNVELAAPRSVFLYKYADGKWGMGPFWDWDAGFDFDWSDMYTGHTYFNSFKNLLLGTDPANRKGARGGVPKFFTDMFQSTQYTKEFKALWNSVKDSIFIRNWAEMEKYIEELNKGAYFRDITRWPLVKKNSWGWGGESQNDYFSVANEIEKMKTWLQSRTSYLDQIINAYPIHEDNDENESKYGILNTYISGANIDIYLMLNQADGYTQDGHIEINPATLAEILGLSENDIDNSTVTLSALNVNGTVGGHTAQGTWGAWFDVEGNVANWASAHVFVEPTNKTTSNVYSWVYGCHPDNCRMGDQHTVRMRYSITRNGQTSYVTVTIHFGINCIPDGTYEQMNVEPGLFSYRNMQSVGEQTISENYNMTEVDKYVKQAIPVDLTEILSHFPTGCTLSDLTFAACTDVKTGELTTQTTSSNGFYMMFDGTAVAWGSSECKIGYNPSASTLDFAYTSDIESPKSGSECTASVFLIYKDAYYYRFRMKIVLN